MRNKKNESVKLKKGIDAESLEKLRRLTLIRRAMNNVLRQKIIGYLKYNNLGTVQDICIKLELEKTVVLQNLAILKRIGIVLKKSQDEKVYFSLDRQRLVQIYNLLD